MSEDRWVTTPITEEFVHGAVEIGQGVHGLLPHRLTAASRRQLGGPVEPKVFHDPSGVRIRLRTESRVLRLRTWPTKISVVGDPLRPAPVYDVWADGALHAQPVAEGGTRITVSGTAESREETEPAEIVIGDLPPGETLVELWLPYEEHTELIDLRSDAPVHPSPYPEQTLRWLHHGSSISHGSDAMGASHTWPAVAARTASAERPVALTNLGFGGNAKLDQFTARTIRETPADMISLKLAINVVNGDSHTLRSFTPAVHGFLDTIREGRHAETPLLVVSPLWCGIHERTPGPVEWYDLDDDAGHRRIFRATGDPADVRHGRLTLEILRAELERIIDLRRQQDENLHFLSGLELYGAADAQTHPLPDGLHPDTAAHALIGERFAQQVLTAGTLRPAGS